MIAVRKTEVFGAWFEDLRDRAASVRIQVRIDRLSSGDPGRHRALAGGVCELKIDHGRGYRVHYVQRGEVLIVLLCGGDKSSQRADIKTAMAMAKQLGE